MNQISLREFQLHASKYLESLPIVLTQYNRPLLVVSKVNEQGTYSFSKPADKSLLEPIPEKQTNHCEAPFCKSIEGVHVRVVWPSDEGENRKETYLCKFHIARGKRSDQEITEL